MLQSEKWMQRYTWNGDAKITYVTCYVLYTYVFLSITRILEHAVTLYGQGICLPQHQSHCLACKRGGEKISTGQEVELC